MLFSTSSSSSSYDEKNRDKIILKNLRFHAYHGVLRAEKELGQKFSVNVELFVSLLKPGETDEVEHTVDYAKAFYVVRDQVCDKENRRDLIEAVAEDVSRALLSEFQSVEMVKVRVEKPCVAIDGSLESLGVEIVRAREVGV